MVATFQWLEDTTSAAEGFPVALAVFGSTAANSFDPSEYPLAPGQIGFEKWWRIGVSMGGSVRVENFRFYSNAPLAGAIGINALTSATTDDVAYVEPVWRSPQAALDIAQYALPRPTPSTVPDIGLNGDLNGSLTVDGASDHFVMAVEARDGSSGGEFAGFVHMQLDEIR